MELHKSFGKVYKKLFSNEIFHFPRELWIYFLSRHLSYKDVCSLSSLSRTWKACCYDSSLWLEITRTMFGDVVKETITENSEKEPKQIFKDLITTLPSVSMSLRLVYQEFDLKRKLEDVQHDGDYQRLFGELKKREWKYDEVKREKMIRNVHELSRIILGSHWINLCNEDDDYVIHTSGYPTLYGNFNDIQDLSFLPVEQSKLVLQNVPHFIFIDHTHWPVGNIGVGVEYNVVLLTKKLLIYMNRSGACIAWSPNQNPY